jgi:hypothetical protein
MAHYIPNLPEKVQRKFQIPKINGKFGFSFYVGMKEVFIGIAVADVILEQIIKKRFVKVQKADTRTYGFDPLGDEQP